MKPTFPFTRVGVWTSEGLVLDHPFEIEIRKNLVSLQVEPAQRAAIESWYW
jgi:hypothetical protein